MDIAVVGGDARFAYLTRLLCSCGHDARAIQPMECGIPNLPKAELEELPEAKNVVMNWPVQSGEGILQRLKAGTRVYFCGLGKPGSVPEGIRVVDLWEDERLLLENAWLTAEGAVAAAMRGGVKALKGCHCLIIGWGRIGRALTEILVGMNVRVTVASRSQRGRNGAVERGAECVSTYELKKCLRGMDVIFSTPPERVLDEALLKEVRSDVRIIDLSSAPYGVDLEAAKALGLNAWREPGLPGRYCPFSAAQALLRAMIHSERKG